MGRPGALHQALPSVHRNRKGPEGAQADVKYSIVPEIILLADATLAGTGIKEVMERLVMCAKQSFVDDVDSHYLHHKALAGCYLPWRWIV